jgi:hypothetical protein
LTAVQLAAGADPRFSFKSIVVFDPAMERKSSLCCDGTSKTCLAGLEPWRGHVKVPILAVNSEEFVHLDDYNRLISASTTFDSSAVFAIGGANHPSFSDINLVLPPFINRMIGLRARPETIIQLSVMSVIGLLRHGLEETKRMARGVIPEATPCFDRLNELLVHRDGIKPITVVSLPADKEGSKGSLPASQVS